METSKLELITGKIAGSVANQGKRVERLIVYQNEVEQKFGELKLLEKELYQIVKGIKIAQSGLFSRVRAKISGIKLISPDEFTGVYTEVETKLRQSVTGLAENITDLVNNYRIEEQVTGELREFVKSEPPYRTFINYLTGVTGTDFTEEVTGFLERTEALRPEGLSYLDTLSSFLDLREGFQETSKGIAIASAQAFYESNVNLARFALLKPQLQLMAQARNNIAASSLLSEAVRSFTVEAIPKYQEGAVKGIERIFENESEWIRTSQKVASNPFSLDKELLRLENDTSRQNGYQ